MKKSLAFPLLLFSMLWRLPFDVTANDWPYWRGPNRNGISNEQGWNPKALEGGANVLWQTKLAAGYSAVAIKDGYLYTLGNSEGRDIVYCLKVDSAEEVWRFAYDCPVKSFLGSFSTPIIDSGCVFVSSRNGDVHCLEALTGKMKWRVNITREFGADRPKYGHSASPVVHGNSLILNACLHGVALDKRTGRKIWASPSGRCGYASPVIYEYRGRRCAAIFSYRRLNGVDLETGELLWSFPWVFPDGADSPDPVVVGDRIFISTAYRNGASVIQFTDNEPRQVWFKKDIQDEFGSPIYRDGYLYVPHGDTRHRTAYLKCIEFDTGKELWSRDTGHCSLIQVDGKFIVLNQWGKLLIMEADEEGCRDFSQATVVETNGQVRCWTAPVFSNGRVYIRTCAGDIVCVDLS